MDLVNEFLKENEKKDICLKSVKSNATKGIVYNPARVEVLISDEDGKWFIKQQKDYIEYKETFKVGKLEVSLELEPNYSCICETEQLYNDDKLVFKVYKLGKKRSFMGGYYTLANGVRFIDKQYFEDYQNILNMENMIEQKGKQALSKIEQLRLETLKIINEELSEVDMVSL